MPTFGRLPSFCALLLAALIVAGAPLRAETSDGPAIVVLDGSGSMWGQIGAEKGAKFDLARGALRQSLAALSPRVELGLLSFGQRRRADCSDVEVLAPPAAGGVERILSIADRLSPKGKGPLALALREAAKQIPAGEAGSIIAIHDGPDNCWQDPCAAAQEIAKANPKTRVYLIGFGLSKAEAQGLACVARSTQGRVLEAHDSTRLGMAISEALTLANLERIDPTTGVAPPEAAAKAKAGEAAGVRLTAALTADGETLKAPVGWRVTKADAPDDAVAAGRAAEFAAELPPGSYLVEARFGQATARQPVEVKTEGATVAKISLGAGLLKLNAQADRAGAALTDPLVTIFSKSASADTAARAPVWIGRTATLDMVLPAGTYDVRVQDGLATHTTEVVLAAGAGADVAPVLGTGRLTLGAVSAASGEPIGAVVYTLEEDDPDAPQGRREVARSADPNASFTLPAGTYYITARHGVAESHDRIALGSGDTVQHVARFNLVSITVTAALASETAAGAHRALLLRVLSEGTPAREIARASGSTATFTLPPGRYRVEAAVSGLNIKAQGIVDLTSGRGGNVQLKLDSGEIKIEAGGAGATRHWRITDREGQTVLHSGRSGSAQPVLLAPGRYVLLSDGAERQTEQAFEVKSGERLTLTAGGR